MSEPKFTLALFDLESVCLGVILTRAFSTHAGQSIAGRPRLAAIIRMPEVAHQTLSDLGVDSLAWMRLLTELESEFEIELGDEVVADVNISCRVIAQAIARALSSH